MRAGTGALCLAAAWLTSGCRASPAAGQEESQPWAATVQLDSATIARNEALEPGALTTVRTVRVTGWTGPGNRPFEVARRTAAPEAGHSRPFGTITLPIILRNRSAGLSQYPCTSCHAGRKLVMTNQRIRDAHHNVQPVHPAQTGAACPTCHAADNVALLVLARGERATLDQSYRLCGQCHFTQADAWAGGGHGKRLDAWQGRRVVMACTDCHDPHRPALQPRIPFRAPILARIRRDVP